MPNGKIAVCFSCAIFAFLISGTTATLNKPIHLVVGGTHLLAAKDDQLKSIVTSLHDTWKVNYVAPAHCTGEAAFAALKESFGDKYVYAGLGSTILIGPQVTLKAEGRCRPAQYSRSGLPGSIPGRISTLGEGKLKTERGVG